MKLFICVFTMLLLSGCSEMKMDNSLGISMMLQNRGQNFVTQNLAERWAKIIVEEKYSGNIFSPADEIEIVDLGDFWMVVFKNILEPTEERPFVSRRIRIKIRKNNGEVDEIS